MCRRQKTFDLPGILLLLTCSQVGQEAGEGEGGETGGRMMEGQMKRGEIERGREVRRMKGEVNRRGTKKRERELHAKRK